MFTKNKSIYFLLFCLCIMFASITHSLRSKKNVLVNSTTLYMTVDGDYMATENMDVVISEDNFEAVTVIKEAGLNNTLGIYTKGRFARKSKGLFNVSLREERIDHGDIDFENDDEMLVYDKYIEARKKLSFFKSVQVVEELPNQYMLIILNSPVKKMVAVKMEPLPIEDTYAVY
ncbi:conserved exported hypothetical protein [Vibrio chagasii]|nr:conserved exported hypothetical protein [Vibrio chagasii]CAH6823491.1 conserved exported hypothetical protein [Vibrio chagasii]CAH6880766.1 conserved exported hypothetical protein [Vibrio chagasii]CAH6886019.1 conserved exported hypothetical protein [Vibrio chagasii]CAH6902183.1 conserved exported hypothetical protein [Vibrio chagasii]